MILKSFTVLGICEVSFGNDEVKACDWDGDFIRSSEISHIGTSSSLLGLPLGVVCILSFCSGPESSRSPDVESACSRADLGFDMLITFSFHAPW